MNEKHMLITGGTGFLGGNIAAHALAKGYRVSVITRNPEKALQTLPPGVLPYTRVQEVDDLSNVSCLVNMAGEPLAGGRWTEKRKQLFFESRVGFTENLFRHFDALGKAPPIIISGSAVGYYGPHNDKLLDEFAKFHDSYAHQLCADWEKAAKQFEALGSRVCRVRTGIVLDQSQGALAKMLTPFRLGLGGVLGSGLQWMPWIHIDDYVALIFHLIKRTDIRGAVNGTAPNAVTNREFTKTLGKVLKRPTIFTMPSPLAKLLFGEMAKELLLTGQRVYPQKALDTGFEFRFPDLEATLRELLKPA